MSDPTPLQHGAMHPGPPKLNHEQLLVAQQETLNTPRRSYSLAARILFRVLDAIYGRDRTLGKFKVLELVARVPYQSWEQIAYVAITHAHEKTGMARGIYQRVAESRAQQDNEQWHLLILQEMFDNAGIDGKTIKFYWLADDYGHFDSLADLFRQIGHDERVHKLESLSRLRQPRFP